MFEATGPLARESAPVRIAVAFHSGYGHTARQAEAVADGARGSPHPRRRQA
ncbi:hypothetical protein J2853_001168 [Streptosporangium lutulentum]|uniref:Flavodoxin-like domain-containing protein n=1 Tax=Streptosporangium lutulentum TaxID=1461250 RepID=A0ABT9Q5L1_9ACTN|nr:hypothetical protein [Streptosporangium lutulentum]MDP9841957.1 hypothetical protein [Streptosporangium lutulentum]